jgi:Ala-tRNA(Pro) deacylase
MIPLTIKQYLDEHDVPFVTVTHAYGVTAQQTAERAHVSGKRFGKTVVLRRDGKYFFALLPANESIDLAALGKELGGGVDLASESELRALFPDCELGAMPPLGGLYGLPVVADACLAAARTFAVNGGTHTDLIELRWEDFAKAEHPRLVSH